MASHALRDKAVVLRPEDDVAIARAEICVGTLLEEPVPSIKLATNSLVYRHMEEDMDINCGVILEGTPVEVVGRQIFEEVIAVASGTRTNSELSGVGEEEFAPWIIGPVM